MSADANVHIGRAPDGKPTPGTLKLEFELDQREVGLEEPAKLEHV